MFTEPTTFILGAGASWHYGYPTGADLIDKIIHHCERAKEQYKTYAHLDHFSWSTHVQKLYKSLQTLNLPWVEGNAILNSHWLEMIKLGDRLEAINPTVIDFFLQENPDIEPIGRYLIAEIIYKSEINSRDHTYKGGGVDDFKTSNDWCRFIINKMVRECKNLDDLLNMNNVNFITFNYDVSLERRLYKSLVSVDLFKNEQDSHLKIKKFIQDKVFHVYNSIRDNIENELYRDVDTDYNKNIVSKIEMEKIYSISQKLKLIPPKFDGQLQQKCHNILLLSKNIYILGYGFDLQNSLQIGLDKILNEVAIKNDKNFYFTNFQNRDRLSKSFLKIIRNYNIKNIDSLEKNFFVDSGSVGKVEYEFSSMGTQTTYSFEKSINNVYDALDKDFDL